MKVLNLLRKEKKSYVEDAKVHSRNKSSIREIVKKEKEIHASFSVATHTAKVMARVCDKCLVKMEKSLTLYKILRGRGDHIHIFLLLKLFILL